MMNFNGDSLKDYDNTHVFDTLLQGFQGSLRNQLLELYQDACRIHYHLFEDDFFKQRFFSTDEDKDGDNILTFILPAIRRVFVTFFMNVPTLFENDLKRKELFQLQFDLEEFLKELTDKLKNNITILDNFKNLDKGSEILQLIVNDYVSSKIKKSRVNNPTQAIREIKLEKHLKI